MTELIGACGINCSKCDIHLAPQNALLAQKLAEHFNGLWENVKPEDFHCEGCSAPNDQMWSSDCWIRKCVHKKGLTYCSECKMFPCERYLEWTKKDDGYYQAYQSLLEKKK